MLTEDYCDFETSKLLKEKGFNGQCFALYNTDGTLIQSGIRLNNIQVGRVEGSYSAPTHQMAMKYLREVHKVVISINAHTANHSDGCIDTFEIDILKNASRMIVPDEIAIHNTYEESVEAALKYILENLI